MLQRGAWAHLVEQPRQPDNGLLSELAVRGSMAIEIAELELDHIKEFYGVETSNVESRSVGET